MASSRGFSTVSKRNEGAGGVPALIVCCLISVLLLTFYLREGESGPIHTARSVTMTITSPVRVVGSVAALPFHAVGNVWSNITAPQDTLSELKKQNQELTSQLAELKEAKKTAQRLEDLVKLKSSYSLKSTAARIIGGTGDAWSDTVTLDKGTSSGFAVGMPVCNSGGAIGQIIEVSGSTSTVRLLTDDSSAISAMVQTSRAQGMLEGQPDGSLRLSYVPVDADVKVGDLVITSGIGGAFPKGLPLGTVSSVEKASNDTYYTIVVRVQSTAESNEEVLVVTSLTADQAASDADVQSANTTPQGSAAADASQNGSSGSSDGTGSDASGSSSGTAQDSSSSGSSASGENGSDGDSSSNG